MATISGGIVTKNTIAYGRSHHAVYLHDCYAYCSLHIEFGLKLSVPVLLNRLQHHSPECESFWFIFALFSLDYLLLLNSMGLVDMNIVAFFFVHFVKFHTPTLPVS